MSRKRDDPAELPKWGAERAASFRDASDDPGTDDALVDRARRIETAREQAEVVLANLPTDTRPDDVPRIAAEILGVDRARPLVCLYVQHGIRARRQPPAGS